MLKHLQKLKTNNKGFSLVELIVVIAILAVGIGIFTVSVSVVFSNNVRKCANNMDAMISKARVNSMYRSEPVFVEFDYDDEDDPTVIIGTYFERDGTDEDDDPVWKEIEKKTMGAATIPIELDGFDADDLPLRIGFRRGTGTLVEVDPANGTYTEPGAKPSITLGEGASAYTIELIRLTGGHKVVKSS